MERQNFTGLIVNPLLDTIDLMHLKAEDIEEAKRLINLNLKYGYMPIILTQRQLSILIAKLRVLC